MVEPDESDRICEWCCQPLKPIEDTVVDPNSTSHGLVHVGDCWAVYCDHVRLDFLRRLVREYANPEVNGVQVLLPSLPRTKAEVLTEIDLRGQVEDDHYRVLHDLVAEGTDFWLEVEQGWCSVVIINVEGKETVVDSFNI